MVKPRLIAKSIAAWRRGAIGEAAAYKAAGSCAPGPASLERQLHALTNPLPDINSVELSKLAHGTFGRAYYDFLQTNRLEPLKLSASVRTELAEINLVPVRYVVLHDAFHALLGFGVDLSGELGVWTFVAEQGYSSTFRRAALTARILYPLRSPRSAQKLRDARKRAVELARHAPLLLALPMEDLWNESLTTLQLELFGRQGFTRT